MTVIQLKNIRVESFKCIARVLTAGDNLAKEIVAAMGILPDSSDAYGIMDDIMGVLEPALERELWNQSPGTREGN